MPNQPPINTEVLSHDLLDQIDLVAFLNLLRGATGIIGNTEKVLRDNDFELTAKEWDVLAFVSTEGPLRPSELLRRTALTNSPQTLSSILDRMEAKEVLTRRPHPDDARGVLVTITDKGSHTVDELFPLLARKVIAPFTSQFTDAEVKTIAELLGRIQPGSPRSRPHPMCSPISGTVRWWGTRWEGSGGIRLHSGDVPAAG
jgi:DNA-binding MarR family transcriptional regulator